jgi:hypothetical protein
MIVAEKGRLIFAPDWRDREAGLALLAFSQVKMAVSGLVVGQRLYDRPTEKRKVGGSTPLLTTSSDC